MSIDIDWDSLTTGAEGLALAETIRVFIDDKFQQIHLPGFIRSVHVHSFDFGQECPLVELKDISDPLPDFYDNDSDSGEDDEVEDLEPVIESSRHTQGSIVTNGLIQNGALPAKRPMYIDIRTQGSRPSGLADHTTSSFLPRAGTPGMPGGNSNLGYFHLPLSAGLSGSQTPLATVAGGGAFAAWSDHHFPIPTTFSRPQSPHRQLPSYADPSSRPSTADSHHPSSCSTSQPEDNTSPKHGKKGSSPSTPSPLDTQITMHITYTGSVSLSITASLLLDYPMSSFASIPLKLSITGLSFDGVALLAYLRQRAHFCFLGAEDAQILVGAEATNQGGRSAGAAESARGRDKLGGLIKEIRVESEIGKREGGKQSLKNVGKVEKFVVEQVRRIFEEEFHSANDAVYPSHRQVVCLALNEVGRRTKQGFVYWIEDDQHSEWQLNAPALFYTPYDWTEKDCAEFDDDPHELRARLARATARTALMSPVLALDLKVEGKADRYKSNGQFVLDVELPHERRGALLYYSNTRNGGVSGVPHLCTWRQWQRYGGEAEGQTTSEQRRTWLDASVQQSNGAVMKALAELWTNDEAEARVPFSPIRSQTLQPDRGDNFTPRSSVESQVEDDEDFVEISKPGDVLHRVKEEA